MMEWKWNTQWKCMFGYYYGTIITVDNKTFRYYVEHWFSDEDNFALEGETDSLRKAQRIIYQWAVDNNQSMKPAELSSIFTGDEE